MRKLSSAVVAFGLAGGLALAGAAHAEDPFACFGAPSIPPTYACLVRFGVGVEPPSTVEGTVVIWYDGVCYYISADGSVLRTERAPSPDSCP